MTPQSLLERFGPSEAMEVDVVIVVGGPACVATAVRLKQLNADASVAVLERVDGFPRWQDGPVFWSRQWNRAALDSELQRLGEAVSFGFVAGNLALLLGAPAFT
ncbi:hypothetical protein K6V72_10255 [Ralstonia insidiosa]|jgi:hypothetical protein|uniref:hypothetical protein n=1 Tax=Ralstonia TaxID=48736 RepID=UPI000CEF3756|nr:MULTISPECIES: hypothetical protein [Ralstonia]MBY4909374.1 hypothetical protein [Ralstonia insidiosa]MDH6643386.1 cation diffusion facilitator CzcD-associated flavoprotein CzcO [Ralstonia sp. GP73]